MSPGSYFCWSYNCKAKTVNSFKTYFPLFSKTAKLDSDLLKAYEESRNLPLTIQTSVNRPFPSSPAPLFQNEGKCSAFDMEIVFHSHANKTYFHKKGCAPSLILKVRVFGTRMWSIMPTEFAELYLRSLKTYHFHIWQIY